ncbi:hypothetical protein TVNIR_0010 [Thioalkalivibrio nitratireducens DSM 14787]|uniref:Uncharacterized protein n=1 Tax=Thioalkalivibrio nitratireducens (strain DSM 14787 / UNIQEM 213 / ALEN2) TaxID=1255043 RepID=L0DQJ0_THIND|nr:hypothetical protein TVNIR_0010 [Thioalkalivibrio nitratireducens DSM 14787]
MEGYDFRIQRFLVLHEVRPIARYIPFGSEAKTAVQSSRRA